MPELPEVETVVRSLRGPLVGKTFLRTQVFRPDVVSGGPGRLARALSRRRVESVERRAKNILIHLSASDPGRPDLLRVHLGMTGKLLVFGRGARCATSHSCVRLRLEGGGSLVYDDVRRFGGLQVLTRAEWEAVEAGLGPEPLEDRFTPDVLRDGLWRSVSPIRSWLLDGRRVAGVGNIYANEALFLAGIRPERRARDVSAEEAGRLHAGIRSTLADAVDLGGTTLRDYVDADGNRGQFAQNLWVYGRDGRPCLECGTPIERTVFGGRSAFHCPQCQS